MDNNTLSRTKKQIRQGCFETNSSSCHTVVLSKLDILKSKKYEFDFSKISIKQYYGTHGDTCYAIEDKISYLITYFIFDRKFFEYNKTFGDDFSWSACITDIFNGDYISILYDIIGNEFKNYIFNILIPSIVETLPLYNNDIPFNILRDGEFLGWIDHQSNDMIERYYGHFIDRYNLSNFTFQDFIHEIIYNDNISIEITSDGCYNQEWEDWFTEQAFNKYHSNMGNNE